MTPRYFRTRTSVGALLLCTTSIAACAKVVQQPTTKVEDARELLPGSWINPPESSDYDGVPSVEIFKADGTGMFLVYDKPDCKHLKSQIAFGWTVEGKVLRMGSPGGKSTRDEIVAIGPETMILHSLDDRTTYLRRKGDVCKR